MRALTLLFALGCHNKGGDPAPEQESDDTAALDTETGAPGGDSGDPVDSGSDTGGSGGETAEDTSEPPPPHPSWSWGEVNYVSDADASLVGEVPLDEAGGYIRSPGDMDGDGIADLVIAAQGNGEVAFEAGKVYIVLGRSEGWTLQEPLAGHPSVLGAGERTQLGSNTAIGDVNSDGLADVTLSSGASNSAPSDDAYEYLLLGRSSGWVTGLPVADVDITVHNQNEFGGTDIKTAEPLGDMDGDGVPDWLIKGTVMFEGEAHVLSGASLVDGAELPDSSALWIYGGDTQTYFEPSGDINGDGLAEVYARDSDFAFGYFILGSSGGLPYAQAVADTADVAISASGQRFTWEDLGDLNGDGMVDFALLVEPSGTSSCGVYLFFGRSKWPASVTHADADVVIPTVGDPLVVMPIGDVNGDGYGDMGLWEENSGYHLYLVFGRGSGWPGELTTTNADVHLLLDADLGRFLGSGEPHQRGDINGDGITDLLLPFPNSNWKKDAYTGTMLLFVGRTSWPAELTAPDADARFQGHLTYQQMGTSTSYAIADVNGDGRDDIAVASYYHPVGSASGETFLFFGQDGP